MTRKIPTSIAKHAKQAAGLSVLLCLHLKLTYKLSYVQDIVLDDETAYLAKGLTFSVFHLARDGWFYFFWYRMLGLFTHDNTSLYYLNNAVLIGLPAYAGFLVLRKLGTNWVWSCAASAFLMASRMCACWPYITKFALAVILLLVYGSLFMRSTLSRLMLFVGGTFLLAYVRPEFFFSFLIMLGIAVIWLAGGVRRATVTAGGVWKLSTMLLVSLLLLFVVIGVPLEEYRSYVAFGQHFALNYVERSNLNLNPWANWERIVQDQLKTDHSVVEAMTNNPAQMLLHMGTNLVKAPVAALDAMLPHELRPAAVRLAAKVAVLTALIALCIASRKTAADHLAQAGSRFSTDGRLLALFLMAVLLPVLGSIAVIFPRLHYLLMPLAVAYLAAAHAAFLIRRRLPLWRIWTTSRVKLVAVAALLYCMPFRAAGGGGLIPPRMDGNPMLRADTHVYLIDQLRRLPIKGDVVLAGGINAIRIYLPGNFRSAREYDGRRSFREYVEENGVNLVIVNKALIEDRHFVEDEQFKSFLAGYERWGFQRIRLKHSRTYLLVKEGLLS